VEVLQQPYKGYVLISSVHKSSPLILFEVEEKFLVNFFGKQYEDYKKRAGTMIPFIR
jgi:protein-S-isoprenylcysteine O-methyltransferase Ste14